MEPNETKSEVRHATMCCPACGAEATYRLQPLEAGELAVTIETRVSSTPVTVRRSFWNSFWGNLRFVLKAVGKIFYFVLIRCHVLPFLLLALAIACIHEDYMAYRGTLHGLGRWKPSELTWFAILDQKYLFTVLPFHLLGKFLHLLWLIKCFHALGIAVLGCAAWSALSAWFHRRKA